MVEDGSEAAVVRQRIAVSFEFPVAFTRDALDPASTTLRDALGPLEGGEPHRVCVVVDSGVAGAWPDLAERLSAYGARHSNHLGFVGDPITVPGGEQSKCDPALIETLQEAFKVRGIDRHAYVLMIGGGAVLDAAGYAAATTHRGVRVVRMPTTVLSQNDSGVGVKNGVNAFGVKNFLGSFAPPFAVINDASFLRTLPARDMRAGLAESVKAALIRDGAFFAWMEANREALASFEDSATAEAIRRTATVHMRHMAEGGDPFELGSARPLDFGHWSAHKLEVLTQHALRHGEAVAIGIALDCRYSTEVGLLSAADSDRVIALLEGLGFALHHEALERRGEDGKRLVMDGLREFQEHLGGQLTITLLQGLGNALEVHAIDEAAMETALRWLAARG